MTERIIDFLDTLVATVGAVDKRYCLVEKRADVNGTNIPYRYMGGGNYQAVNVDGGSISYFRLVNSISFDVVDGNKAVKNLQGTYPIRYVAMVRRDDTNPLAFSQDVANVLEGRNKDLQTQLQAKNVNITVNSIDTDTVKIWGEEFAMPLTEPNYTRSMVMINLTVTVIAARSCWENCDDFPDILRGFDWCSPATVARLTDAQRECLRDFLCETPPTLCEQLALVEPVDVVADVFDCLTDAAQTELLDSECVIQPCAPATFYLNSTEVGAAPSGGSLDVDVEDTTGTDVGSLVGGKWQVADSLIRSTGTAFTDSVEAEKPYTIADVPWTDSDGTPMSSEYGTGIVCTPISPTPPTWIGGKSIYLDGVNDDMQGRLGMPNELETYGFGFVINDPTSAIAGIVGMAGFGYLNSSQGTRNTIDIWCVPNSSTPRASYENVLINRDISNAITKDTPSFLYFQVSGSDYKSYVNGVQFTTTVLRANKYKIRFDEITLGYSRAVGTRRNCRMWTPLVTDGTLSDAEVAALSVAVLGNTTPLISSKILDAWDFGRMPTGVPSTSSATPTAVYGMRNGSPIYCSPTFAAPFGVVEDIT